MNRFPLIIALIAPLSGLRATTLASNGTKADVDAKYTAASGGRTFTDGVLTSGIKTITSASAAFVAGDVGRIVSGNTKVPTFALIASVESGTSATLTVPATSSGTSQSITLGGDTITLPPGPFTWTSALAVTKSLQIRGAGSGLTTITFNGAVASMIDVNINVSPTVNQTFFLSGMTIKYQNGIPGSGMVGVGTSNCAGYPVVAARITDVVMEGDSLDGVSSGGRFISFYAMNGVVDHCDFIARTNRGAGNVSQRGDNYGANLNTWHTPITYGDQNAMYIENCRWLMPNYPGTPANFSNDCLDHYIGSRWVARYCEFENQCVSNHGFDSTNRGGRSFEIYNNLFEVEDASHAGYFGVVVRSGTGYIFNNTFQNPVGTNGGTGITAIINPYYYAATTNAGSDLIRRQYRADAHWPKGTWGALPYGAGDSTANIVSDGYGNRMTGNNPLDGNWFGPAHMDAGLTRTVTNLNTTAGSKTITSATINFTSADLPKVIRGTNIDSDGRQFADAVITNGSPTVTSATANFTAYDVGRGIASATHNNAGGIPDDFNWVHDGTAGTKILSVTNSTTIVMDDYSNASATGVKVVLQGNFIESVTNSTTAVLRIPATGTTTTGTLTIGYTDQGYPGLDMPGWGSFPVANAGAWPTVSAGYSVANFQQIEPMYFFANTIISPSYAPPHFSVNTGAEAYLKADREWYDQASGVQGSPSSPFNGTTGTGWGTLANRPTTCTTGVGYWATDQSTLYKATATNTWSASYTPLVYPHPMITNMMDTSTATSASTGFRKPTRRR